MKKFIDAADKFTQYALAAVLTLFAIACMFSGCRLESGQAAPTETTTEREETMPEFFNMGEFKLTAYCPCSKCCGKWADGYTKTETKATEGRTIAVDEDVIPFGSEVIINGQTYIAEDCGGGIIGREIDIYFDSHEEALEFGVQYANVTLILNGGDDV